MSRAFFSGSYAVEDVRFLLKPITLPDTPIDVKESLIQSGKKHYSELLSHEALPNQEYVALFYEAMAQNQQRLAQDLLMLAAQIAAQRSQGITLVSLARAGTPVGVLLKHILQRHYGIDADHYSISILRDVGIDQNALQFLIDHYTPESLVFIDGWTGKGTIAKQLVESLQLFAANTGVAIPAKLYVLVDLSGHSTVAASSEDYLIPSCILNATVSGLVSRSIYDRNAMMPSDFHGCVYYQAYLPHDLSNYFIRALLAVVETVVGKPVKSGDKSVAKSERQAISKCFLQDMMRDYGVGHSHYIKPGIGEATRVLLRRKARLLLLRESSNPATQHLRWLAQTKAIPIEVRYDLPYQAAALITEVKYD